MGTLWTGGTIYTLKNKHETVEAVYTENGMICETGTRQFLKEQYKQQITEIKDLGDQVMYPGFVDSHLHMVGYGEKLLHLDLSSVQSSDMMRTMIADKASYLNADQWLIGDGWNENNFPDRKIFHRDELDDITREHPVVLTRICHHALLANTKALELAGVTEATPDPEGGVIVRDDDGRATGLLLDQAQNIINDIVPVISEEDLRHTLKVSVHNLLSYGLVGGHTEDLHYHGGFKRTFNAFQSVIDGEQTKFRAHLLIHNQVIDEVKAEGWDYGTGTEYVTFDAMKIFADGALGAKTALLAAPYNDAPETSGVAIYDLDGLKDMVKKARDLNMPVVIHTIGDLALEYAVTAIEAYPVPEGRRDRLVHTLVVNDNLLERLQRLPVVLDIQPQFVTSDFPWVRERLGEERLPYAYAWKTLLDRGIHCAAGSDAPIEIPDPLLGIHALVTRKKPQDTHEGYGPDQKLTPYEAVSLYTKGSAYVVGREETRGQIAPGFTADFTILDQDLFMISPEQIPAVNVGMTVVSGIVMYENMS